MKSIIWKKGFFFLTFVFSLLLGFWGITNSYLYMEFLMLMSRQKMDVMWVDAPKQLGTELYIAADFLIAFAVPFGLIWLLYFLFTRYVWRGFRLQIERTGRKTH